MAGGTVSAAGVPRTRLGQRLFAFIEDAYRGKAARLRLEVEEDNVSARRLYERLGYQPLPYLQMIKE